MEKKQVEDNLSDEKTKTLRDIKDLGNSLNRVISHKLNDLYWCDSCSIECYIELLDSDVPKNFITLYVNKSITIPEFTKALSRGFGGIYIKDLTTKKYKIFIISALASIRSTECETETFRIRLKQYKND